MNDFLGKALAVGQMIVYPGRASSSLWMNHAKIEALDVEKRSITVTPIPVEGSWRSKYSKGKPVKLTSLDRVVVVG